MNGPVRPLVGAGAHPLARGLVAAGAHESGRVGVDAERDRGDRRAGEGVVVRAAAVVGADRGESDCRPASRDEDDPRVVRRPGGPVPTEVESGTVDEPHERRTLNDARMRRNIADLDRGVFGAAGTAERRGHEQVFESAPRRVAHPSCVECVRECVARIGLDLGVDPRHRPFRRDTNRDRRRWNRRRNSRGRRSMMAARRDDEHQRHERAEGPHDRQTSSGSLAFPPQRRPGCNSRSFARAWSGGH